MTRYLIFAAVVTMLLGIIAIGHVVVFHGLVRFVGIADPRWIRALRAVMAVLAVSFITLTFASMLGYNPVTRWLYASSAVWLGTAYWLAIATFVAYLVVALARVTGLPLPTMLIGRGLLGAAVLVSAYGLLHSFDTRVTRYEVALPNLPASWEGKSVAMIADTHLGNVRNVRFSEQIAGMVAAEKPELLLIAGDFFDGPPANFAELAAPFGKTGLRHGVFFGLGNHEEFGERAQYTQPMERAGVTVLSDQVAVIDGLQIVGLDYSSSNSDVSAAGTLAGLDIDPSLPSILIKHVPNSLAAVSAAGIDLQVSGHTHGGQIWPGAWITSRVFPGFSYGKNERGDLTVITTSGAGTWGPPQRVGSDPEIVIITLTRKEV